MKQTIKTITNQSQLIFPFVTWLHISSNTATLSSVLASNSQVLPYPPCPPQLTYWYHYCNWLEIILDHFKIYILVTYRQRVKFLIKNLQRPITLPVTYMKIDSKGHSFYCVLEIWLTDSWIVYEYGWTRTVLPQHWCNVLKINKNSILTYLLCKNLSKESCWICDGVKFFISVVSW